MQHFRSDPHVNVTSPAQVAVVGDRLFTDVMMANMMGSHSVWVKDGVIPEKGIVSVMISHSSDSESTWLLTGSSLFDWKSSWPASYSAEAMCHRIHRVISNEHLYTSSELCRLSTLAVCQKALRHAAHSEHSPFPRDLDKLLDIRPQLSWLLHSCKVPTGVVSIGVDKIVLGGNPTDWGRDQLFGKPRKAHRLGALCVHIEPLSYRVPIWSVELKSDQ